MISVFTFFSGDFFNFGCLITVFDMIWCCCRKNLYSNMKIIYNAISEYINNNYDKI